MREHGGTSSRPTITFIYLLFTSIQFLYLHAICQSGGCVKLITSSSSLLCSGGGEVQSFGIADTAGGDCTTSVST